MTPPKLYKKRAPPQIFAPRTRKELQALEYIYNHTYPKAEDIIKYLQVTPKTGLSILNNMEKRELISLHYLIIGTDEKIVSEQGGYVLTKNGEDILQDACQLSEHYFNNQPQQESSQ